MNKINGTMMQYFEWYMNCNQNLWNKLAKEARNLSEIGITALWLPPAYKGIGGKDDVGYGVYDLYDLGEFNQKGSIKTKYGSKEFVVDVLNRGKKGSIGVMPTFTDGRLSEVQKQAVGEFISSLAE